MLETFVGLLRPIGECLSADSYRPVGLVVISRGGVSIADEGSCLFRSRLDQLPIPGRCIGI